MTICIHVVHLFGVNLSTAEILRSFFFLYFTFNNHLEKTQKLDMNQDFLIVGPGLRDAAVGWKTFGNWNISGKLTVRMMKVHP